MNSVHRQTLFTSFTLYLFRLSSSICPQVFIVTFFRFLFCRWSFLLHLACFYFLSPNVYAVGPRAFKLDTVERLSGGYLQNTSIGADAVIRAGLRFGTLSLPNGVIAFSALRLSGEEFLLGTGPDGKIFHLGKEGLTLYAETKTLAVTSLVKGPGDFVYAATIPDGKIFKLSQNKAELFSTVAKVSHIWALAYGNAFGKNSLFAATGSPGNIYEISPSGAAQLVFGSLEPHLISLAITNGQGLLAGSSGNAILYHIKGQQSATALYDFSGSEVRAIQFNKKNGDFFVIANEYSEAVEVGKRDANILLTKIKPGKGLLAHFDMAGSYSKWMSHADTHYLSLWVDNEGRPFVGTGIDGRVYHANESRGVSLMADTDSRQISVLIDGLLVGSDPANVYPIYPTLKGLKELAEGPKRPVWMSAVLDAGLVARFGKLSWKQWDEKLGTTDGSSWGSLNMQTRSGNTKTPGPEWSDWSSSLTAPGQITSPKARYIQIKATWQEGKEVQLSDVLVSFVTENVMAVVTEISHTSKYPGPGREAGTPSAHIPLSGGEVAKHDALFKLTWKVDNPDNDTLLYTLRYKREDTNSWIDILKPDEWLSKTEYEWDTSALSQGIYRVQVEASDHLSNPLGTSKSHVQTSSTFLIDNIGPTLVDASVRSKVLKFTAQDDFSSMFKVEISVDGRLDFRPIFPVDGLLDSNVEKFELMLASYPYFSFKNAKKLTLRLIDAAGNLTIKDMDLKLGDTSGP